MRRFSDMFLFTIANSRLAMATSTCPSCLSEPSVPSRKHRPIERMTKGIFEVVYEKPPAFYSPYCSKFLQTFQECRLSFPFAMRLLTELMSLAPLSFAIYASAHIWLELSPACSLYFTASLLSEIEGLLHDQRAVHIYAAQHIVALWCLSVIVTSIARRVMSSYCHILNAHMKLHLYPQFAKVSLTLDSDTLNRKIWARTLPWAWGHEGINGGASIGWEFVMSLSLCLGTILRVLGLCMVLLAIVFNKTGSERLFLIGSSLLLPILWSLAPTNGVYGAGYAFWTTNAAYHRLAALHSMVFDSTYKNTLMKDGATEYLHHDYTTTLEELGAVCVDAETLMNGIPRPWYWDVLQDLILSLPLGLCAVSLSWIRIPRPWYWDVLQDLISGLPLGLCAVSVSWISWKAAVSLLTTLVLAKKASELLQDTVTQMICSSSLCDTLRKAREIYETLELDNPGGSFEYTPAPQGMNVSFKDVSFQYREEGQRALHDISFDIHAGQVILLVGANGSGKTTLLNLLLGLIKPTSGHILIDGKSLNEYDATQFRSYTATLLQNEEIYPVSLRDNLLISLADASASQDPDLTEKLDAATRMGGSYDFVQRLGYDRILNPVEYFATASPHFGMNGPIGDAVMHEMRMHSPVAVSPPASGGEKQRFVASRLFMRINNKPIKLLVIDEMTALDSATERDILNRILEQREGKTTIIVTHRFASLVKQVDSIFVMGKGTLVQCGIHEELIANGGEYARLYGAQTRI